MGDKMKFKTGDVVQLKSGGPALTVVEAQDKGANMKVSWFDAKGIDHCEVFAANILKRSGPETPLWIDPNLLAILASPMGKPDKAPKPDKKA